jgi:hypothetical protein
MVFLLLPDIAQNRLELDHGCFQMFRAVLSEPG